MDVERSMFDVHILKTPQLIIIILPSPKQSHPNPFPWERGYLYCHLFNIQTNPITIKHTTKKKPLSYGEGLGWGFTRYHKVNIHTNHKPQILHRKKPLSCGEGLGWGFTKYHKLNIHTNPKPQILQRKSPSPAGRGWGGALPNITNLIFTLIPNHKSYNEKAPLLRVGVGVGLYQISQT